MPYVDTHTAINEGEREKMLLLLSQLTRSEGKEVNALTHEYKTNMNKRDK